MGRFRQSLEVFINALRLEDVWSTHINKAVVAYHILLRAAHFQDWAMALIGEVDQK